ncbi:MAG TPA: DUF1614 domain-containing protein [Lacipirellulaceae bacterium]|nr:DUF1614 domain-containing protein [Lacipirellulaceae bacterium]
MYSNQLNYLPLTLPFFSFLAGLFVLLLILIQVRVLHFAYTRLGLSSGVALFLLLASLLGSYVNIPVWHFPEQRILTNQEIGIFGMRYVVPTVADWPGTVIAVNVGGAVIPGLLSLYLLIRNNLWVSGVIATACVAAACYALAEPVPGMGIAIPALAPPAITAIVALIIARRNAAALAYISGSLGTLIGADLLNIDSMQNMGASVASIGGAGTFDGIFLTGIVAVLFASLSRRK